MAQTACQQLEWRLTKIRQSSSVMKDSLIDIRNEIKAIKSDLNCPITTHDEIPARYSVPSEASNLRSAAGTKLLAGNSALFSDQEEASIDSLDARILTNDRHKPTEPQTPKLGQGWGADIDLDDIL